MGIESYSIHTEADKNTLNVNFVILGKLMEPQDYQPILDRLQAVCTDFNTSTENTCPASSVASKVTVPLELDTNALDEAQKEADKLKATLSEVLETVRDINSTKHELTFNIRNKTSVYTTASGWTALKDTIERIIAAYSSHNLRINIYDVPCFSNKPQSVSSERH